MNDGTKPNVIVCLCDQLRAFEVGCYGNNFIKTPNIDRLAEKGVRFETASTNNPLCSPARSMLLTGQYSRTCTGTTTNTDHTPPLLERKQLCDTTLPEAFKKSGYDTALIGKWHIQPDPGIVGFDYTLYPHHRHRNTGQTYFENSGDGFVVDEFAPDYEIEQVEKYIGEHKEKEFFLFYNISPPHMPLDDAPEKYKQMYDRDKILLRENVWQDGKMSYDERWFKVYMWDFLFYDKHLPYTEELPEGFDLKELTALYYGLTTWVDDLVGRMMKSLEDNGLAENTIVIFTSDHGDNLGSHGFFNKGRLIEEAIRIPMLYHWPKGLAPQENTTQVASIVDIMPSLLGLAGVDIPGTVQGTDLSPVLIGNEQTVGENVAYIEEHHHDVGIRTPTHLYGVKIDPKKRNGDVPVVTDDRSEFYDVKKDPFEYNNLAKTDEQIDVANDLRERVLRWNRETPWLETKG